MLRTIAGAAVVAAVVGISAVAFAAPPPEEWPQDQASCEAAGMLWAMDPDGRDQMVCLYVGDGDQSASDAADAEGEPQAPPGASDRSPATSPSPGPSSPGSSSPARAVPQQPEFTG
jgi:hypothetical protein